MMRGRFKITISTILHAALLVVGLAIAASYANEHYDKYVTTYERNASILRSILDKRMSEFNIPVSYGFCTPPACTGKREITDKPFEMVKRGDPPLFAHIRPPIGKTSDDRFQLPKATVYYTQEIVAVDDDPFNPDVRDVPRAEMVRHINAMQLLYRRRIWLRSFSSYPDMPNEMQAQLVPVLYRMGLNAVQINDCWRIAPPPNMRTFKSSKLEPRPGLTCDGFVNSNYQSKDPNEQQTFNRVFTFERLQAASLPAPQ